MYRNHNYIESINILNEILNEEPKYITPKFYLMLNYYNLKWWEMAYKTASEILPYYGNDYEKYFIISYVRKFSKLIMDGVDWQYVKKERESIKKNKREILRKYGIK